MRMWILGLALLGASATAATPTNGKLKPGAAEANYLVNVYDTQSSTTQQGTKLGTHIAKRQHAFAQAYSRKKPSAAVASKAKVLPGAAVQATAYSNLSYDYIFHAKNQAAYDLLAAYAAAHDGTIAVISGFAKQYVTGSASALTSIDAGAATTASFACTDTGGDCSGTHKNPKFSFIIPGAVTISDAVNRDFAGHIYLTSLANAYSAKSYAYAFIDPEVALPGDFGGDFNDFSIELSEGVDNAIGPDSIPEPNSWALLITGFGLAGGAMRRRSVRSTA